MLKLLYIDRQDTINVILFPVIILVILVILIGDKSHIHTKENPPPQKELEGFFFRKMVAQFKATI